MKKFTALALVAGLSATGAQAQDAYDLIYDAATGEVSLNITGNITNYVLENDGTQTFLTANHVPFVTFFYQGGAPVVQVADPTLADNFVAESLSTQDLPGNGVTIPQVFNIGAILPAGLSPADAEAAFNVNRAYVADLGTPVTEFDFVYVPEPTSLALLGLGGLLVARRRR